MSLINRKARPLTRDSASLRDDRLFIVACDDTYAPKQYFDFFRIARIQVHVVPTEDGTSAAHHVLDRLLEFDHEEDDELWLLLDTDHYTKKTHVKSFMKTIKEARRQGVNIALSKPCFELWLLLHHIEEAEVSSIADAKGAGKRLQNVLGQYDKTSLKRKDYPLSSVAIACQRAKKLDASTKGGHIPKTNTTRVYRLWEAMAAKALPTQLPAEFIDMPF